jgi:predicted Zn finger-like uncharacterized protein
MTVNLECPDCNTAFEADIDIDIEVAWRKGEVSCPRCGSLFDVNKSKVFKLSPPSTEQQEQKLTEEEKKETRRWLKMLKAGFSLHTFVPSTSSGGGSG